MLLFLILAPFVFNLSGLIDTYLTQLFGKYQTTGTIHSSTGTLMIIGGVVALFFASGVSIIWYNDIITIPGRMMMYLLLSGIAFGIASFPYFEALKIDKIENIFPILQTTPVFVYVIANIVLGETLSPMSLLLMLLIVLITGMFSRNITTRKIHIRSLLLVLFSSIIYASSYVLFKLGGGEDVSIWVSYFWQHVGIAFFCLLFLLSHRIRNSTVSYFKNSTVGFSLLNIANELFFIIGILIVNYFNLLYPIAFVSTLTNGLQPLLGFIMVYIAYKIFPLIFEREYTKKELAWKIILCIVSFVLIYLFYNV